jgi:hypothetical protein
MSVAGPFLAGDGARNNQFTLSISPSVSAIPAGALAWFIVGGTVADTANITITDSVGNNWWIQSFNQLPGTGVTIMLAMCRVTVAIPSGGSVTLTCDTRDNWVGALYYHTGSQGQLFAYDIHYFPDNTNTQRTLPTVLAGQTLFAVYAVQGQNNFAFTQDANWSADIVSGAGSANATIHASGRTAPVDGAYTYHPVLASNRKSMCFMAAFN